MAIDQKLRYGTIDRIIELEGTDHFAVNLFPYQIKNRDLFYDRKHPKNISPYAKSYDQYWTGFLTKCVEGKWVLDKDKEGNETWVFMPPKLFFYINYQTILDKHRDPIKPRLRDNEWIMSTYFFIMDGFSGFEDDEVYTCNDYVRRLENYREAQTVKEKTDNELAGWEITKLDSMPHLRNKKTGKYKTYVDPWVYLTEHYLINNQKGSPLGQPIYDNHRQNAMLLAARTCGKSYWSYSGDLMHEFLLNGIRRIEDVHKVNNKMLMTLGAKKSDALERTLADISNVLISHPGTYSLYPKYGGAFYKNTTGGAWEEGNKIVHKVQRTNRSTEISGNEVQLRTIKKAADLAGGRQRRIGIEEVGFVGNITKVFAACENSVKVDNDYFGSIVGTGTGGEQDNIEGSKDIYENPRGYNVVSIPNYYVRNNRKSRSGLFLSVLYASEDYKDEQGNTRLLDALKYTIRDRVKLKANKDAESFLDSVMFNPLYPKEMLIPKNKNRFPVKPMAEFRAKLKDIDYMDSHTKMGWFYWDKEKPRGVRFDVDLKQERVPLFDWGKEDKIDSKEGVAVMYEDVITKPPEGLYYVCFDPVATSGNGSSLNTLIVYKADYYGRDSLIRDNIVLEWTGRHESITDTYEFVVMIAKYYNAQIFQETNVPYFNEWARLNDYLYMFFGEPLLTMKAIYKGRVKPSFYGKGVRMNTQLNNHAYLKLADWFKEVVEKDDDGVVIKQRFHKMPSLRLLSEAIHYEPDMKTHFDGISTLYLMMILKTELSELELEVDVDVDEEEGYYEEYDKDLMANQYGQEDISFLDY
jgi:hypothetical protein